MFKKIDAYIIKRYLMTFFVMLLLFIPIGIMVDVAEKIDKFKENEVPFSEIVSYYIDFMWYFGNLLFQNVSTTFFLVIPFRGRASKPTILSPSIL